MNSSTVLFFKPSCSTFIQKDEHFLASAYRLRAFHFRQYKGLKVIFEYLRQSFFFFKHLRTCKVVFVWFADYHSLVPILFSRLFFKKSFLVLGGSDTTYIKQYNYGVFSNFIRRYSAKYSIENANVLLPVDQSLIDRVYKHAPNINGETYVLPTGYDSQKWFRDGEPKSDTVLTVVKFNTYSRMMIKGVDRFIELARANPDFNFRLIGVTEQARMLVKPLNIPNNLTLIQPLTPVELRIEYSNAKFYAQLSRSEGLPNAVCESMLCECIPICTKVGGMEKLAQYGIILDPKSISGTKLRLFEVNEQLMKSNRLLILEYYSNSIRENTLLDLIN